MTENQPRSARWRRVRSLFDEVCDLDPAEREATLARACSDDPALRAEVESILANSERAPDFLETPVTTELPAMMQRHVSGIQPGDRLGPYRIERLLDSGGMGSVYLGIRADDRFSKRVAVKILDQVPVTSAVRNSCKEAGTLARLDHPDIARLLDAGQTENGTPYLVLEYVVGTPVIRHCDDHALSIEARLRLFSRICRAVHAAHQCLVVHRDLKPNNILVTEDGSPKLLDFGIAKVLEAHDALESAGRNGATTHRRMTREYASPEQIRGERITTSCDVYALGVLLCELLTGVRPYHLHESVPHEFERAVCEDDATPPSRLIDPRAHDPGTCPGRNPRRLAGDLDAILTTALQRDPDRRYASAQELAGDLDRHLAGLPVAAQLDTLGYRVTKFVRRNRTMVGAAVITIVVFAAAAGAVTWQAIVAATERDEAVASRQLADRQAARAERMTAFLYNLLTSVRPEEGGVDITVREVVDQAAAELGTLDEDAATLADLHATLGITYRKLGLYDSGEQQLETAIRLIRDSVDARHQVAAYLQELGSLRLDRGDLNGAEELYREALDLRRAIGDRTATAGVLMLLAAATIYSKRDFPTGVAMFEEALVIQRDEHGPRHPTVAATQCNLGITLKEMGEFERAEGMLRTSLATYRELHGDDDPVVATTMLNLAECLRSGGDADAARPLFEQALLVLRRTGGNQHPHVAHALDNLAALLLSQGEAEAAATHWRESAAIRDKLHGSEHPRTLGTRSNLARALHAVGDIEAAEALHAQVVDAAGRTMPPNHWFTASFHGAFGEFLLAQERFAEAEPQLLRSHSAFLDTLGAGDATTQAAAAGLVRLYRAWGKPDKAASFDLP